MAGKFHHEQLYRGDETVAKLAALRVALCGCGAVGSNLADNLARQGLAKIRLIDLDRVEEHNVSTQVFGVGDVGAFKAEVLRNRLFRTTGAEAEVVRKELTAQNVRPLLKDVDLVVDAFDNSASRALVRQHCRAAGVECLHLGLYADYAEVIWDANGYRVPRDVAGDVCDYPLARNLVLLAVAVASEAVLRFVATGERTDWTVTLADLAVRPCEAFHTP